MNIQVANNIQYAYGSIRLGLEDFTQQYCDSAIAGLTNSIQFSPENPNPYYQRAGLSFELGDYESVVSDTTTAIEVDPDNAHYYDLRGLANFRLHQYSEAIRDFRFATAVAPTAEFRQQAEIHFHLAQTWIESQQPHAEQ